MKNLTYLMAERDTLQNTVDQINDILKNKRDKFTPDEIVLVKRRKSLLISELKSVREEIKALSKQ